MDDKPQKEPDSIPPPRDGSDWETTKSIGPSEGGTSRDTDKD